MKYGRLAVFKKDCCHHFVGFLSTCLFALPGYAVGTESPDGLWQLATDLTAAEIVADALNDLEPDSEGWNKEAFQLDYQFLSSRLAGLSEADGGKDALKVVELYFPTVDGNWRKYLVTRSVVLSDGLAKKYPSILTYKGRAEHDPTETVRFTTVGSLSSAVVSSKGARWAIRRIGETDYYRLITSRPEKTFDCKTRSPDPADKAHHMAARLPVSPLRLGQEGQRLRLAVAATGEYVAIKGGKRHAMGAIADTINQVNGIFERDLAVQLVLVTDNDKVLFEDPNNDPFKYMCIEYLIDRSQEVIDEEIGDMNYDLGHLFYADSDASGMASLGGVGISKQKALGASGQPNPDGKIFDVDYVAHEIGHQLGAEHTFNGKRESCETNWSGAAAFEPGSGSTIMAYAGVCGDDNIQDEASPYFHFSSILQISHTLNDPSRVLPPRVVTRNTPPEISALRDYFIPSGTPFYLEASASDVDNDDLTYCWEQSDLGVVQRTLDEVDDGNGPIIRSQPPWAENYRYVPSQFVHRDVPESEKLPAVSRDLTFALTVRDNAEFGGIAIAPVKFTVLDSESGPFQITSHADGRSYWGSTTLRWNVAGTNEEPIGADTINIEVSLDGGETYEWLLYDAANDGEQTVELPAKRSRLAKFRISPPDNVFYAVSERVFEISPD